MCSPALDSCLWSSRNSRLFLVINLCVSQFNATQGLASLYEPAFVVRCPVIFKTALILLSMHCSHSCRETFYEGRVHHAPFFLNVDYGTGKVLNHWLDSLSASFAAVQVREWGGGGNQRETVIVLDHVLIYVSPTSRDRLEVRTLRCGRNNPGSSPDHSRIFFLFFPFSFFLFFLYTLVCSSFKLMYVRRIYTYTCLCTHTI